VLPALRLDATHTAEAATSTGSHDGSCNTTNMNVIRRRRGSRKAQERTSFNLGSFPVVPAVRNINGQPSDSFQIPCWMSPQSWPIRKTCTRSRSAVEAAFPHICSVTHLD
jgi:hypothetical protein